MKVNLAPLANAIVGNALKLFRRRPLLRQFETTNGVTLLLNIQSQFDTSDDGSRETLFRELNPKHVTWFFGNVANRSK